MSPRRDRDDDDDRPRHRDHDKDDHDGDDEDGNGGQGSPPPAPKSTPYLVLAADAQDTGARPIAYDRARRSQAIRILDVTGKHTLPTYTLQAEVTNTGLRACYMGIAEFYIGNLADFDVAASDPTLPAPPMFGIAAFVSLPGKTTKFNCPVSWMPGDAIPLVSVLVQAYDPIFDPLQAPYSMVNDRHVGVLELGA
jgi:hypothetical protein